MNTQNSKKNAHNEIDHIFKELLPAHGMKERTEQIDLSHRMLDAMLDSSIGLFDAGTGIGKTYAYLVAGMVFQRLRVATGLEVQPILISTSSIALQNAVKDEYLPLLSSVLMADGLTSQPIQAVIRKGKSHYVCEERLRRRLVQVDPSKKNRKAMSALRSLESHLDISEASQLSRYDQERVCVPLVCDCRREDCRYLSFLDECNTKQYLFQICNHNLLLADAIRRGTGRRPILPDACALIVDEAHKLPEVARQMFGITLRVENIRDLIRALKKEKYILAAESLADMSAPLLRKLSCPFDKTIPLEEYTNLLAAPSRTLSVIEKQLHSKLQFLAQRQLEKAVSTANLFCMGTPGLVPYTAEDEHGGTMLCAAILDLSAQLRSTLWQQTQPILLTSATLSAGGEFRRFREKAGLLTESRVTETVSFSPFDYQRNCLLYFPRLPPKLQSEDYYDALAAEITALLKSACGHALVLFTSYSAMSAVKVRLFQQDLCWPVFTLGRNAAHTTERFKDSPGSILLATGAAWEGFDFPGDCVSLLIIPRLPFPHPDAMTEKNQEGYPGLHAFIRAVIIPEMQIKLKQGFGRAIRTETDTCVIAILDERACPGQRYFRDVLAALPEMNMTSDVNEIEVFIHKVKGDTYFREARL